MGNLALICLFTSIGGKSLSISTNCISTSSHFGNFYWQNSSTLRGWLNWSVKVDEQLWILANAVSMSKYSPHNIYDKFFSLVTLSPLCALGALHLLLQNGLACLVIVYNHLSFFLFFCSSAVTETWGIIIRATFVWYNPLSQHQIISNVIKVGWPTYRGSRCRESFAFKGSDIKWLIIHLF